MPVSSLALGVYGRLTGRPDDEHDCYSVFHALSSTLGWSSAIDGSARGAWAMNDAGGPWFGDGLCGWVQVEPDGQPLPVEALTDAAVRTLERFGTLDVTGLDYHVPGSDGSVARRLLEGQAWFALAHPEERTGIRATLACGSALVVNRWDAILDALSGLEEEGLSPVRLPDDEEVTFEPSVPWRWWLGDSVPRTVTLGSKATEWSPLGLGRVVARLVHACRSAGITEAVGVRVSRA